MKNKALKSLLFAIFCGFLGFVATAAVSIFSDYGQIQNVQNYSSNPFWTPDAPYNQRLPQPVYVQGADLNTEDCISIVQFYVSNECAVRDNCRNTTLSDIRPTIMVALSNLPKHNYVSACGGYIDGVFESYVKQFGNNVPNRPVAFPGAINPNPDVYNDTNQLQIENPYKIQTPKWQQEIKERNDELEALQRQNGAGGEHVSYTDFPATYADLSFSERINNERIGLEPFKDLNPYKTLNVKSESEWCSDHPTLPECKEKQKDDDQGGNDEDDNNQKGGDNQGGNDKGDSNQKGGGDQGGNDQGDKESEPEGNGLCSNSKFNLSETASTIFKKTQVHTPEVAHKLAEEYVKCSTEPNLNVASKHATSRNDDYFSVTDANGVTKYKIIFDDVKESYASTFCMDTIEALCLITKSTIEPRHHSQNGPKYQKCVGMTENQFKTLSAVVQELIGRSGDQVRGSGKWCYKITFEKSSGTLNFSVTNYRLCVNEIVLQN